MFNKKMDIKLKELDNINVKLKEVIKTFDDVVNKIATIESNISIMQQQLNKLDEKNNNDMMVQ